VEDIKLKVEQKLKRNLNLQKSQSSLKRNNSP